MFAIKLLNWMFMDDWHLNWTRKVRGKRLPTAHIAKAISREKRETIKILGSLYSRTIANLKPTGYSFTKL